MNFPGLRTALALVACLWIVEKEVRADLDPNGINVCHHVSSRYVEVVIPYNSTTYDTKIIKYSCGWWDDRVCYRSKLVPKSVLMYRKNTELQKFKIYNCCSGWSAGDSGKECTKAVCGVSCQNGGSCIRPGVCLCAPGFGGKYCQNDIDECQTDAQRQCDQTCVNTYGSFSCSCLTGYKSNDGGYTCKDIDECNSQTACQCAKNDGVCVATCKNNPGSYSCSCPTGYKLKHGVCEDRNECVEDISICGQKCVNQPGSFKCECFPGFIRNATSGKCEDADECSLNNGGCSDFCHNVVGGSVCTCKTGAFLDKDGKTCKAIQPPYKGVIVCEDGNNLKVVDCPNQKTIGVLYAEFGRLSTDYCQTGNYTMDTRCKANDVMGYIDRSCNHRSACTIMASKALYGDPCPGISKYLQVVYECL